MTHTHLSQLLKVWVTTDVLVQVVPVVVLGGESKLAAGPLETFLLGTQQLVGVWQWMGVRLLPE